MNENNDAGLRARQDWIDFAKGIGIILVVWAHTRGFFSDYIGQFHMPLFFFISGYLYQYSGGVRNYTVKKVKGLLLPFWWWNMLLYPVFYILYYWNNWNINIAIKEIIEIILTLYKVPFLGATWFLTALFWISILSNTVIALGKGKSFSDLILLLLGISSGFVGFYFTLPYKLSRVMICSFFYMVGYLFKKYLHKHIATHIKNFSMLLLAVLFNLIASNNYADMGNNQYSNKFLFIIGALAGTMFVLRASELVTEFYGNNLLVKHIVYLGKNTMDIVIWHFLAFRLAILLQIVFGDALIKNLVDFPVSDASGIWLYINALAGIYGALVWGYILRHNPATPIMKKIYMIR